MILLELFTSKGLFLTALSFAIVAFLYSFAGQIIKEVRGVSVSESVLSSTEVSRYFLDQGYIVCNVTKVKNSNKWLVFVIRNGEYCVMTVYSNGDSIVGHEYSAA